VKETTEKILNLLQQIKTLPAQAGSSSKVEGAETVSEALPTAQAVVSGETGVATVPAPETKEDQPPDPLAAFLIHRAEAPIRELSNDPDALTGLLDARGIPRVLADDGTPMLLLKDGSLVPQTIENLTTYGSAYLLKATGVPGSGIRDGGSPASTVDVFEAGLKDQAAFDSNRKEFLRQYTRSRQTTKDPRNVIL